MVRLTKIYTKTGDDGTTGLGDGRRVRKDDLRVSAYGDVDEANAALGVAVEASGGSRRGGRPRGQAGRIRALLESIQHDLFDCGADLCCPRAAGEAEGSRLRITPGQVERLERAIDEHNAGLAALSSFVLPGGSALSAALHTARTVVRRAERSVVALMRAEEDATNMHALVYLNRLSDLLFVLSRVANRGGKDDVLWVPGATRASAGSGGTRRRAKPGGRRRS
ncbi:MAG: cob(I)yrinic acid a,c-diamide adenosyltransferase [Phycisphaerales bacterium]